jgi:glycosyltransferase involved in cell wall biosynthesis
MKILFITLARIDNIEINGIYTDLLRKFREKGHDLTIVSPNERKFGLKTAFVRKNDVNYLNVWTTNIQKTNILEKGLTTLFIENIFLFAIKKYLNKINFDLIIYTTPPITFTNLVRKLKKRAGSKTYLLLKDIFPQNAVDLNIINVNGFLYKYFRHKEKVLYNISDYIGCMSPANLRYIIKTNPQLDTNKIEVNPNSIEVKKNSINTSHNFSIYEKYSIPTDKIIFLFGGNIGEPQGIEFLIQNIDFCKNINNAFFLIVGNGTKFKDLYNWVSNPNIKNAILINEVPQNEFDNIVRIAHVGLIFLNPLFSIPNFPSRILSYMKNNLPVICATDSVTDIGNIASENNFGFHCLASNSEKFSEYVIKLLNNDLRKEMGNNAYEFLINEYTTEISYNLIIDKFLQKN